MRDYKFLNEDVLELLKAKQDPCVSIIVPTHKLEDGRQADMIEVKHAVSKAAAYLKQNYTGSLQSKLVEDIEELSNDIDFTHNALGIGIFVSPTIKQLRQFHFPVTKKIIIGHNFETRDILYETAFDMPYYVLLITEKMAQLFEGHFDKITEVAHAGFPLTFEDDYIYQLPAHGNSYTGSAVTQSFEKDKSILETIRHTTFFRKIDAHLDKIYLDERILVVAAVTKDLSLFKQVSRHTARMFAAIVGNYTNNLELLKNKAWDAFRQIMDNNKFLVLKNYGKEIGYGHAEEGIENIWQAAKEGRALTLLVEKDFKKTGFVCPDNEYRLHLTPPLKEHRIVPDAVDDIIEMVLDKNGEVIFLDNGILAEQQGLALITRY